jgi:hypothetical protein
MRRLDESPAGVKDPIRRPPSTATAFRCRRLSPCWPHLSFRQPQKTLPPHSLPPLCIPAGHFSDFAYRPDISSPTETFYFVREVCKVTSAAQRPLQRRRPAPTGETGETNANIDDIAGNWISGRCCSTGIATRPGGRRRLVPVRPPARVPEHRPWATLAASVAAIPTLRSHRASAGTCVFRRAESSFTIELVDQPVHREQDQAGSPTRLTVRPHEIVGVFAGSHRSHRRDAEDGNRGRPPNDAICPTHRAPREETVNSEVRAMSIMYVSCESTLGHSANVSDLRLFVSGTTPDKADWGRPAVARTPMDCPRSSSPFRDQSETAGSRPYLPAERLR